jgi:hypothetical protein
MFVGRGVEAPRRGAVSRGVRMNHSLLVRRASTVLIAALLSCGGGTSPFSGSGSVAVSPASLTLTPGAKATFSATMGGSPDSAVTWSVLESGGGSITSGGVYDAPIPAGVALRDHGHGSLHGG